MQRPHTNVFWNNHKAERRYRPVSRYWVYLSVDSEKISKDSKVKSGSSDRGEALMSYGDMANSASASVLPDMMFSYFGNLIHDERTELLAASL